MSAYHQNWLSQAWNLIMPTQGGCHDVMIRRWFSVPVSYLTGVPLLLSPVNLNNFNRFVSVCYQSSCILSYAENSDITLVSMECYVGHLWKVVGLLFWDEKVAVESLLVYSYDNYTAVNLWYCLVKSSQKDLSSNQKDAKPTPKHLYFNQE